MGTPEQRAEAYGKAVQDAMLELQRVHLLPLMKESFLCSAACVDRASNNDLQTCLMRCQRRPEAAKHLIESRMQDFQARMQRCVQRCQDEVQETLPTQPSDREIAKAQESLAKSMAECADTYRMKQLPKLKQDLAAELPAVLQQVQQSQ